MESKLIFLYSLRTGPPPVQAGRPGLGSATGAKRKKFQPSFDAGSSSKKSSEDHGEQVFKEDIPEEDNSKYFKTCHAARFEGMLLDLSFVNKILVCLTSTPSDEPGNVNESERIRYSGDQVTIFQVDKAAKTITISSIVMLKGRCSGICLNENAKFFYSLIQKKKELAKFKVVEQEMSTKLQPLAKCPTPHELDVNGISRARNKPGFLVLDGRDGQISMHSNLCDAKKKSYSLHLFHHATGGLVSTDMSKDQNILSLNLTGALQLFQPKGLSMQLQSSFSVTSSPKAPKVDPFVLSLFHMTPVVPKVFAPEISWDEMQEQARVARERKRYEQTINEVTTELEAMRAKVAELLEENNKLPEAERMDVHDFELDVEEQQRRVNEGMDKEDDLRFELKAWQIGIVPTSFENYSKCRI